LALIFTCLAWFFPTPSIKNIWKSYSGTKKLSLTKWLIDKIFRGDSSETVWRSEGKTVTIQMDSSVPDLTKFTKEKRLLKSDVTQGY
jgi:hypothetical protein